MEVLSDIVLLGSGMMEVLSDIVLLGSGMMKVLSDICCIPRFWYDGSIV